MLHEEVKRRRRRTRRDTAADPPARGADLCPRLASALRRLFVPGTRVVVGTSGGPDSQTLLDVLARSRPLLHLDGLFAVGIDHGLRVEANAELGVARALAEAHGVPFICRRVTLAVGGNLLAEARRARYQALLEVADEVGATLVAVAHTATDQAETVLLHLTHGCGLGGAGGMRARRGRIVRPLLEVTREEVFAHVAAHALAYASDPSNQNPARARTRLRENILPELTRLNIGAVRNLAHFASLARADERELQRQARRLAARCSTPTGALLTRPLRRAPRALFNRVLRAWIEAAGLSLSSRALGRLERLVRGDLAHTSIGGRHVARLDDALWLIANNGDQAGYNEPLATPGRSVIAPLGVAVTSHIETRAPGDPLKLTQSTTRVAFDADRLHLPLCVRTARRGERLHPFGLSGSMKVGDLFTNQKLPRPLRPLWPIVALVGAASHGEAAWVVGLRRSALAPLTSATRRMLIVEVEGALPWSPC